MKIESGKNMNILVFTESYSSQYEKIMHYVHTRNLYYVSKGNNVITVSFSATKEYIYEGVKIVPYNLFKKKRKKYIGNTHIYVFHAPNLRHHYREILKLRSKKEVFIFFHGHEVLRYSKRYPKTYKKLHSKQTLTFIREIYDVIKLKVWRNTILKNRISGNLVFVSNWMLSAFLEDTGLNMEDIPINYYVINNTIGSKFVEASSNLNYLNQLRERPKEFSVATFRTNMDTPKYGIDLIVFHAQNNPKIDFHIFSKTKYFYYYDKPKNLHHHNVNLSHEEIIEILPKVKLVYLPTRLDSQGVTACEIATVSANLLVSSIDVMTEMLYEFKNVQYISNDKKYVDFRSFLENNNRVGVRNSDKFSEVHTVKKELDLFKHVLREEHD